MKRTAWLTGFLAAGAVTLATPIANSSPIPDIAALPVAAASINGSFGDRADDARDRDRHRDARERRDEQLRQQLERRQERREESTVPQPPVWQTPPSVG
ncbi:hypothetical protein ACWFRB_08950 [Rhodococcus sp. NPDC055112]